MPDGCLQPCHSERSEESKTVTKCKAIRFLAVFRNDVTVDTMNPLRLARLAAYPFCYAKRGVPAGLACNNDNIH